MNSKILLSDFVLECQLIEEYLKKLILLFSEKINKSLKNQKNNKVIYKINKKSLNNLPLGGLINEIKKYTTNKEIIIKLDRLRMERNKLIHKSALELLTKTDNLKIEEDKKDKILNIKLCEQIDRGSKLSNECFNDLIKLIKEI